jgi:hypothetical protein
MARQAKQAKQKETKKLEKLMKSKSKELTEFIINKVMVNDYDLNFHKEEVQGIQDRLFTLILSVGGGQLASTEQLQAIKVMIYDQRVFPDKEDGNKLKALGREKMNPEDKNVSAKADDRMQASPTVKKVFSECAVALRSISFNTKGIAEFGAGFESQKRNLSEFQTFNDSSSDNSDGLRSAIRKAKEETDNEWFIQHNRISEINRLEKTSMKKIIRDQDNVRLGKFLDAKKELIIKFLDVDNS